MKKYLILVIGIVATSIAFYRFARSLFTNAALNQDNRFAASEVFPSATPTSVIREELPNLTPFLIPESTLGDN